MPPKKYTKKPVSAGGMTTWPDAEYLVIVESPSKIAKITSYLGPGYRVIASMGHITRIDGLKSIDVKNQYHIQYSLIPSKKSHVASMREVIQTFPKSHVILATDNDREGEAIGAHLCEVFGLPMDTTRRIVFNEITEAALQAAVAQPTVLNLNIIRSQNARQVLDLFIGYKLSPMLWKYVLSSKSNSLSAGRCQTPALRLVYDNYLERQKRTKKTGGGIGTLQYKTVGHFFPPFNVPCELDHTFVEAARVKEFLDASPRHPYTFVVDGGSVAERAPPAPWNTAKMLQTATHLIHASPKAVMSLAQQLYQEGHITYMRTESKKYSCDFLKKAEKYIVSLRYPDAGDDGHRYVGDLSRISNEGLGLPHEAIRVTDVYTTQIHTSDAKLNSLYKYIWRNTVESCMSAAVVDVYKIRIAAPLDHHYVHSLEIPRFLGWKRVFEASGTGTMEKETNQSQALLMAMKSAKTTTFSYLESFMTITGTHSHYTESGLIHALEEMEIGRPSTFSMFVETIQERGYVLKTDVPGVAHDCVNYILRSTDAHVQETRVTKVFGGEQNKLVIQPLGILCIEFLLKYYPALFEYSYTKNLEHELDEIGQGTRGTVSEGSWYDICEKTRLDIKTLTQNVTRQHKGAIPIDDEYDVVFQGFGPCLRRRRGVGEEISDGVADGAVEVGAETEYEYVPIKPSVTLDVDDLVAKKYTATELALYPRSHLGVHDGRAVTLRSSTYGVYLEWGDQKKSIGNAEQAEAFLGQRQPFDLQAAIRELQPDTIVASETNSGILRVLNDVMSVRRGKYGLYVFYKTVDMAKPKFVGLKSYKGDPLNGDIDPLVSWCIEESCKTAKPRRYMKKT